MLAVLTSLLSLTCLQILNMVKLFGKPLRVNKAAADRNTQVHSPLHHANGAAHALPAPRISRRMRLHMHCLLCCPAAVLLAAVGGLSCCPPGPLLSQLRACRAAALSGGHCKWSLQALGCSAGLKQDLVSCPR